MKHRTIRTIIIIVAGMVFYALLMPATGLPAIIIALLWLPTYAALVGVDSLVRRWVGD